MKILSLIISFICLTTITNELLSNPITEINKLASDCGIPITNNPQTICSGSSYSINGHLYTTSGSYRDTIITMQNCDSIIMTNLTVKPTPTSDFTANTPVCLDNSTHIYYTGAAPENSTFQWDFSNGIYISYDINSYQVKWNTAGTYPVSLTVIQNGCASVLTTYQVNVTSNPTSTFNILSPVCINNHSIASFTGSASNAATFFWSFGEAGSGVSVNPGVGSGPHTMTFDTSGVFGISLLVTDSACASSLTQHSISVTPVPTSNFIYTSPVCVGVSTNLSYADSIYPNTNFNWNFDNGVLYPINQGSYDVYWDSAGIKTVSLMVNINGCYSLPTSHDIIVSQTPQPSIILQGNTLTSNAVMGNQWYNQSGQISGATFQTYVPIVTGDYYTLVTRNGCVSNQSNIIHVVPNGISENSAISSGLEIQPNPAKDNVQLNISLQSSRHVSVELFDITGNLEQTIFVGQLQSGISKFNINTFNLASGVYSVHLKDEVNNVQTRLIISK